MRCLPGPESRIYGIIKGNFPEYELPVEMLLRLKPGAKVMFRSNRYNSKEKRFDFVNGDIGTVIKVFTDGKQAVDVRFMKSKTCMACNSQTQIICLKREM